MYFLSALSTKNEIPFTSILLKKGRKIYNPFTLEKKKKKP